MNRVTNHRSNWTLDEIAAELRMRLGFPATDMLIECDLINGVASQIQRDEVSIDGAISYLGACLGMSAERSIGRTFPVLSNWTVEQLAASLHSRLGFDPDRDLLMEMARQIKNGSWTMEGAEEFLHRVRSSSAMELRWEEDPGRHCFRFSDGVEVTYEAANCHNPDSCRVRDCRICLILHTTIPARYGRSCMDNALQQLERERNARAQALLDYYTYRSPSPIRRRAAEQMAIDISRIPDDTLDALNFTLPNIYSRNAAAATAHNAEAAADVGTVIEDWKQLWRKLVADAMADAATASSKPEPEIAPLGGRRIILEEKAEKQ
jgi:hypothetical protein